MSPGTTVSLGRTVSLGTAVSLGSEPFGTGTLAGDMGSARRQRTLYCHGCVEPWGCPDPHGDALGAVGTCHPPASPAPGVWGLSQPCASRVVGMEVLSRSAEPGGSSPQGPRSRCPGRCCWIGHPPPTPLPHPARAFPEVSREWGDIGSQREQPPGQAHAPLPVGAGLATRGHSPSPGLRCQRSGGCPAPLVGSMELLLPRTWPPPSPRLLRDVTVVFTHWVVN
ncbi:uncharacterized protein ACIBXB_019294 [Morphnus guianensis]